MITIPEIARQFTNVRILGVGESAHGVHEFFTFKKDLFVYLVEHFGFTTFMLEDTQGTISLINTWVSTGEGSLDELMNKLYPVWNVDELKNIILWLRGNVTLHPIEFVGFDIVQTPDNVSDREQLMAQNILDYAKKNPSSKILISAHNYHLKYTSVYENDKPMGVYLKKALKEEYQAIAQFFGTGTLSAAYMPEDGSSTSNRTLGSISIASILSGSIEQELNQISDGVSIYTDKKELANNKVLNMIRSARSIGWGVMKSKINEETEEYQLNKEFSGVMYSPKITATKPL